MDFGHKMEATLVEIQKLVFESRSELSQIPLPSPKTTPLKTRPMVELKTPLPQCPRKELVIEAPKIEVLAAPIPATKMTEKESETPKTTSFELSPWKSNRKKKKKKKEPIPEPSEEEEDDGSSEELEEEEVVSFSDELELEEEEAEPAIPPPEKKKL